LAAVCGDVTTRLQVLTIETIINQYIRSCQEIPMNLEGFEEDFDDGDNKVASNRSSRMQQQPAASSSSSSSSSSSGASSRETCSPGVANSNLRILSARHGWNKITSQPPDEKGERDGHEDDKNPRSGADGRLGGRSERIGGKNRDQQVLDPSACRPNAGHMDHPASHADDKIRNNNCQDGPHKDASGYNKSNNRTQLKRILHVLFTCIQQIASFALRIPSFQLISTKDQEILLRGSVLEMCFIRSGFRFDPQYESWCGTGFSTSIDLATASTTTSSQQTTSAYESWESGEENWYRLKRMKLTSPRDTPLTTTTASRRNSSHQSGREMQQHEKSRDIHHSDLNDREEIRRKFILSAADIKPFISDEMFRKHMHFIRSIRELDADQVTIILLSIIVLLNPDRAGLQDVTIISKEQERFLILLRSYMNWRFGEVVSPILFGKFFLKLPDLKELSEVLSDCQLCLGEEEVKQVYQRLSRLSLSLTAASGASNGEHETSRSIRPPEDAISSGGIQSEPQPHHQHQHQQSSFTSSSSSSSPGSPLASPSRPWVFRIDAIPQTSEKSLSHASHQEDDASRSCSSSPSESIASTDGPFSPT
jgi:hypothetical protein